MPSLQGGAVLSDDLADVEPGPGPHVSLRKIFQRTADGGDLAGGNLGVDLGGPDAAVAQNHLDLPQVLPALQEMGGEGVAEHVRAHDLADAGGGRRAQQSPARRLRADGVARFGREQPGLRRLLVLVVGPQQTVELAVHGHHPFLATLAVADVDHLLHGINVPSLQQARLRDPQAGGVDQGEKHAVLGRGETVQEFLDFRPDKDRRQVRLDLGTGDPGHLVRLAQGPSENEFQGGVMLPEPGGPHRLATEVIHPPTNGLLAGLCQVAAYEVLKSPDGPDVGFDGSFRPARHSEIAGKSGQR